MRSAFLVLAAFAGGPAGCALVPAGGGPTAGRGGAPSAMGGLRDLRVAFHCHSHLSHDSEVPFDRIAGAARSLGFDAVVLDDHYAPGNIARSPHGFWDGVLFVPGVEIRPGAPAPGRPDGGSLLVFGIDRDFDPSEPRVRLVEELRARGAVAAAGHAEEFEGLDRFPLDAFEVYNLHAQFTAAPRWKIALRLLFLFPDRFFEASVDPAREVFDRWDREIARGRRLAPLAGHDAHENVRVLWAMLGTYPEVLRLFSNHVLARDLSAEGLLDGVRRGHTYVSFDFLGDPAGFAATYGPPAGARGSEPAAIPGDEAAYRPDSRLEVVIPADGWIRVLRDGAVWREERGRTFSAPLPGPGAYRVEVERRRFLGSRRLWIVSAPIYVKEWKA